MSKEDIARENAGRAYNKLIARQSSWLCEFLQDAGLTKQEKQMFIKFLVKNTKK